MILSRMAARAGLTTMMALTIVLAGAHVPGMVMAAGTAPDLGVAGDFAVLAYSTVTNDGETVIAEGDVGVYPLTSITGFPPGVLLNGTIRVADGVAQTGQADLAVAYANLAGQAADHTYAVPTDLGGITLPPGVYRFGSSAAVTGTLTLDAGSDPNPVWIFQIGSTLTVASGATVALQGAAASACNSVFWQVGTSATLVTGATFVGDILAMESISMQSGASTTGRLLARTGAVTLIGNVVKPCDLDALPGILSTFKFYDVDGDGAYDVSTDIPLAGWEFKVEDDTPAEITGSPFTTDEFGFINIVGLTPGNYDVTETVKPGWVATTADSQTGTVVEGEVELLQFGNALDEGAVGIFKFHDWNGNGTYDPLGDTPLAGWEFAVVDSGAAPISGSPFTTDASGFIVLTGLDPDTYTVTETVELDWQITTDNDQPVTVGGAAPGGGMLYFGNLQAGQGILTIFKFNDVDGNGTYDPPEDTFLANWSFNIEGPDGYDESGTTDGTGLIVLTGLVPGDYDVSETLKPYWTATTDNSQTVTVSNTVPARLDFGNRFTYVSPRVVGGEASPVNKVALLMPWLIILAVVAAVAMVARRGLRSYR